VAHARPRLAVTAGFTVATRLALFAELPAGPELALLLTLRLLALWLLTLLLLRALALLFVAIGPIVAVVAVLVIVRHEVVAARALFLEPRPGLVQDAKIMFGKLKVGFGLDAIAGKLGIARKRLVFLEQLGGIAALPVVLAIARARRAVRRAGSAATAATAAVLTIVDQTMVLVTGG
jgi:hypothetical protein